MHKIIIAILLLSVIIPAQSSTKYLIYFTDKGINQDGELKKNSVQYIEAEKMLSERSIERRKKTLGENYITYEDIPIKEEYVKALKNTGAKIVWKLKWFNAVSAFLSEKELKQISELPFVEKIEEVVKIPYKREIEKASQENSNGLKKTNYTFNYGGSLTQYQLSDIPEVHDLGINGEGVVIGIMDAGFAWRGHRALKNNDVIAEHDFVYGDTNTDDNDASHGTAVFSLMAGFDEGYIVGPAFGAKFILAKTENISSETHVEEDNYAAALEWMDSIGADITSSSLGYNIFDSGEGDYTYSDMDGKTTIVTKATEIAFSKGILCITSAGNEGNNSWKYITAPGDGINIITVGAVNSSGALASFSSIGPTSDGRIKPEVVAQGVSCYHATAYNNSYGTGSGTSYSAPIVAGITGQLLSAFPYLTNKQMRKILMETSDNATSPNNRYGYGLLSAKRAIEFPNINTTINTGYVINKIIIDTSEILNDSVKIFFSINSDNSLFSGKMSLANGKKYFASPEIETINPNITNGDTLSFYFEYYDNNLNKKRIPINENYKVIYNSENITLGGKLLPPDPIPNRFDLLQNYPNPFNPETQFRLIVPKHMFVSIIIYNVLGEKIKEIASKEFASNSYTFSWKGTSDDGSKVSSGVYIYSAISEGKIISKKMMFIK